MSLSNERTIAICAVASSSYGSEGTPSFTVAAPMYRETKVITLSAEEVNTTPLSASLTSDGTIVGGKTAQIKPGFLFQGHGGDTDPTNYRLDPFLRACAWIRSAPGTGTIRYKYSSGPFESARIKFAVMAEDGTNCDLWDLPGSQGTVEVLGTAGQPILVDPTFQARYVRPTATTKPASILTGSNIAEYMQNAPLTLAITAGSNITPDAKSFKITPAYNVGKWRDFGSPEGVKSYRVGKRDPTFEFLVGFDHSDYINLLAAWEGGYTNRVTATFTHGSVVGRFMKFTQVGQLKDPNQGAAEIDLRTVALVFAAVSSTPGTADSEFQLDLF